MSYRTTLSDTIPEATTPVLAFQIVDADGDGFLPDTLTLTLYASPRLGESAGPIVNSRDAQDVLNANGVTVDSSGHVSWQMTAADTACVRSGSASEIHVALFQWTWDSGNKAGKHEIAHAIANLQHVP